MIDREFWRRLPDLGQRLLQEIKNLIPLFRYLVLQTETHAFCLALASAATLAFFPSCLVMLAVFRNVLKWEFAYDGLLKTIQSYVPVGGTGYFTEPLNRRITAMGPGVGVSSLLWVLVGAAGVFVPLETALNRLWKVREDRPYWMNQIVGFSLTVLCTLLALFFLTVSGVLVKIVNFLPGTDIPEILSNLIIHVTMTLFLIASMCAFYKFLPNTKTDVEKVLPAAILAGVMAELVRTVYLHAVPQLGATQGPFATPVRFMLLAYFESFVMLGCAFLASQTERYPWMGFLTSKRSGLPPQ
jgi:membrane protein